jgi:23S rRNA (uracil1939-C5)-methyltransferase
MVKEQGRSRIHKQSKETLHPDDNRIKPSSVIIRKPARVTSSTEKHSHFVNKQSPCPILEDCGACTLLEMDDKTQLAKKTADLKTQFRAAGQGFENIKVAHCISAGNRFSYRHTAKLVVSEKMIMGRADQFLSIGLYKPGSHRVVDIGNCPVQAPHLNAIVSFLRRQIKEHKIQAYDEKTRQGDLRYLAIRTSHYNRETIVTFISSQADKSKYVALAREMMERFSTTLKGVLLLKNDSTGNAIFPTEQLESATLGASDKVLTGVRTLTEGVAGLELRVSAESFFQVNPAVAEIMYSRMVELADPQPNDNVLELYCGVGPLGMLFAKRCRRVLGVEENPIAIDDAIFNAAHNKIPNIDFRPGRAEDVLESAIEEVNNAHYAIVALNPSRRGCQPAVLKKVTELAPRRIVYMSCNPETLIRDAQSLVAQGYRVLLAEPYDMFPGTPHIEVICLFEKVSAPM